MKKKNKWEGLNTLLISVAVFFLLAGAGIVIEKLLGYDEYKPITYVV